ncbi:MAG: site-specific integrase [candidate division WOR-3 bacterium]|nr:site-specific integrase [candidate division WOR-3 bacterium]
MTNIVPKNLALTKSIFIVPYLLPAEIKKMIETAKERRRGDRDALLIKLLFITGLRISEALSLTLANLERPKKDLPFLRILGKGKKPRMVACPPELADSLEAYARRHRIGDRDRLFPISRKMAYWIVRQSGEKAGLTKKVYPHLLRHSCAIERLRQTGNPWALQMHLGHSTLLMTMRYLSTLGAEESLRIQQEVKFEL